MPTRVWTSNTTCFETLCSFWGVGFLGLKFGSGFGLKFGESESGSGSGSYTETGSDFTVCKTVLLK